MKEFFIVMTRKGQITVPAEIRRTLKLKQGDKIGLSVRRTDKDKIQVTLRPVQSVAEMTFGSVAPRKRPEDFDELRRMFEESVAEEAVMEDAAPRAADED
ncbi:MAG: AbrB/MazE/SpoVT family DNA-binding domain-containing protein [Chloroflexi bacterium]|nr:AbrB/MazE/SpoVT family DNA-binding domain-containing protein [Chloroflexota bacterium]MDA8188124.1 AbrB/MazE/SpoVT family DNA-binding domain-containing protein [Dehalococcoidales bacterium]